MELYPNNYYHIYNRSNNNEIVYKTPDNFFFFIKKYRQYFEHDLETIAYCLMPTHFHFLVMVKTENVEQLKKNFGILLSSYTKAINVQLSRHGSLFQQHTRARHIDDEQYLLTLLTYIHQNPVRAGLSQELSDWEFSSYLDYINVRNGTLPKKDLIMGYFNSVDDFKRYSNEILQNVNPKYWV